MPVLRRGNGPEAESAGNDPSELAKVLLRIVGTKPDKHRLCSDDPGKGLLGMSRWAGSPLFSYPACWIAERRHAPGPTGRVNVQNSSNLTGTASLPERTFPASSVV